MVHFFKKNNYKKFQKYEDQIESLQKQVMEQSMTMSMYSSITPDDYHNEEDVFGEFIIFAKSDCVMTGNFQSECFISSSYSYDMLKFL